MSVELEVGNGRLEVRLHGVAGALALKSSLEVPLSSVTGARAEDASAARDERPKLRAPGTHVPGLLIAGSYGKGESRQLWCAGRSDEVLTIDLEHEDYARIVVGVDDPAAEAARINEARA